jgi:predicted MFS family arabinose efflux permease
MTHRQIKAGVFVLEGLNSFALTYYFYYFYFFTRQQFGFGNQANLALAAATGLICVPAALWGGRFAQRAGYFDALKVGFGIIIIALALGWQFAESPAAHVALLLATVVGMGFTWPTLEALVSEGETYSGLQRNIGFYNVVWAGTGALAYFIGGALLEKLGLKSLFFVPLGFLLLQFGLTFWLHRHFNRLQPAAAAVMTGPTAAPPHPQPPARARSFLRMAWLANPFAYIAMNTLVAAMPGVAHNLNLTTAQAGFCCSLWCFARVAAFGVLWFWAGWHYRFRWLLASYLVLVVTFVVILVVPNLAVVVLAQLALGGAVGLIYYSSLFYSMDAGDTKGVHGGIHEAAIGLGSFAGPAVGAASLYFLPHAANAGAWAVSALLAAGLGGLIWLRTHK